MYSLDDFGKGGFDDCWCFDVYYPDLSDLCGSDAGVNSMLRVDSQGLLTCSIDFLHIPEIAQNLRLGQKIMAEFARSCMQMGVHAITSEIMNPYALRIRRDVFGDSALHMFDDDNVELEFETALSLLTSGQSAFVSTLVLLDEL
jgi:hypothetical protein